MRTALAGMWVVVVIGRGTVDRLLKGSRRSRRPPPAAAAPRRRSNLAAAVMPRRLRRSQDGRAHRRAVAGRPDRETPGRRQEAGREHAAEENKRLLTYDKTKLPDHQQVFASIKKPREAYGKAKNKDDVEKIRQRAAEDARRDGQEDDDDRSQGGNSNVVTDYDVMLDALSNGYPGRARGIVRGDKKPLEEQNKELDKRRRRSRTGSSR